MAVRRNPNRITTSETGVVRLLTRRYWGFPEAGSVNVAHDVATMESRLDGKPGQAWASLGKPGQEVRLQRAVSALCILSPIALKLQGKRAQSTYMLAMHEGVLVPVLPTNVGGGGDSPFTGNPSRPHLRDLDMCTLAFNLPLLCDPQIDSLKGSPRSAEYPA
jgi:hypothetical protein